MQQAKREHWGVLLINFGDKTPLEVKTGIAKYLEDNKIVEIELPDLNFIYANKFEMEKELKDMLRKFVEAMRAEDEKCLSTCTEIQ